MYFFSGENLTYQDYQDIEAPVVCHPHKQPKVIQELGQTASLSCRVSKVKFKILTPGGLIHYDLKSQNALILHIFTIIENKIVLLIK